MNNAVTANTDLTGTLSVTYPSGTSVDSNCLSTVYGTGTTCSVSLNPGTTFNGKTITAGKSFALASSTTTTG